MRNAFAPGCGDSEIGRYGLPACLLALALAAVPLAAQTAQSAAPPPKSPVLVLLGGDPKPWQDWCAQRGWHLLTPWASSTEKNLDLRVKTLETQLADLRKRAPVDDSRTYLAGQGEGSPAVFYVASRLPDLWTAAVALGGSPRPAIDTHHLYTANTSNLPVLWLFAESQLEPLAKQMQAAGYNLEWHRTSSANPQQIFEWLFKHERDQPPTRVDCETGSPTFARCYWVEMTRFDPAERNDVLVSTRMKAGSGAMLAAGPFGFDARDTGPGVVVSELPPNYSGPLKLRDRILAIGGKPLADSNAYLQWIDQTVEEKPVVIMVQRGESRVRVETRIVLPQRDELVTARVQAEFLPEMKELQVLSRAVAQMRVNVPAAWTPLAITWNGTEVAKAESGGCWLLNEQKALLSATRCP